MIGIQTRIRGIQGLRGIAVGLVLLNHFKLFFPNGYIGVDVFFVISGFVITRQLVSLHEGEGLLLGQFYLSRFRRLFAPLAFVAALALLIPIIVGNFRAVELALKTGLAAVVGLANVAIQISNSEYFAPSALANPLLHTWSLSVEEQFYIVYPLMLIAILKARLRLRPLVLWLAAAALLVSFSLFLLQEVFAPIPYLSAILGFYSPVIRAWEFGLGALVYWLHKRSPTQKSKWNSVLIWAGLTGLLVVSNLPLEHTHGPFAGTKLATLFAALITGLLLFSSKEGTDSSNPLETATLRWLGDRSYSTYLTHYLLVYLVAEESLGRMDEPILLLAGLAVSIISGSVLFRLVERGGFSSWFRTSKIANLAFALAAPLVLLVFFSAAAIVNPRAAEAEMARNVEAPTCHGSPCWTINGQVGDPRSIDGRKIFLVGDSNARMFYWPLESAARDLQYDLVARTHGSCPLLSGIESSDCNAYTQTVLEFLEKEAQSIIVLGFSDEYAIDARSDFLGRPEELVTEVLAVVNIIESMGHEVLVIEPIPNLNATSGGIPELVSPLLGDSFIHFEGSLDVQNKLPDTVTFRTASFLCPKGLCEVLTQDKYVYRDGNHLTKLGALRFSEHFRERLLNLSGN